MYIILGGTGHVGSAVAGALLARREAVTIVTRDEKKKTEWEARGARVAIADSRNIAQMRAALALGRRLFLLNPPAPVDGDPAREETLTVDTILQALEKSDIEKVVAESTYGAQPGDQLGDLGVLHGMEQRLAAMPMSTTVIRAAYYMSNWDASLDTATREGVVHSLYPPDFKLPMVAPHDIGEFAARLLCESVEQPGPHYVEGPERYSTADVAASFAAALGRSVEAAETPREGWIGALQAAGFSSVAAESMAAMTDVTLQRRYEMPEEPHRGPTTLRDYVRNLVTRSDAEAVSR